LEKQIPRLIRGSDISSKCANKRGDVVKIRQGLFMYRNKPNRGVLKLQINTLNNNE
jgi:hypothetical protein